MIQAEHLSKTYSIIDKEVGLKGSIKVAFSSQRKSQSLLFKIFPYR